VNPYENFVAGINKRWLKVGTAAKGVGTCNFSQVWIESVLISIYLAKSLISRL
jgi:hypothetical protein